MVYHVYVSHFGSNDFKKPKPTGIVFGSKTKAQTYVKRKNERRKSQYASKYSVVPLTLR